MSKWFRQFCYKLAPKPVVLETYVPPERLSANFTLAELTRSGSARRRGIDNTPNQAQVAALQLLVNHVLQPARKVKGALSISSGFRCKKLNKAIGGAKNSDHMYGRAADITPTGHVTLKELGKWIEDHCEFKQLILEFGSWLHVSYDADNNKGEVLEAYHVRSKITGKRRTRYRAYRFK